MRPFSGISYSFQDTPFQARKTKILEVRLRPFFQIFSTTRTIIQKKLSSVPRQYLCGEYTRKTGLTDAHNFKKLMTKFELYTCTCYTFAPV